MTTSARAGPRARRLGGQLAVAGVALFALTLRAEGMLGPTAALSSAEYDEGVYVAAAAALAHGHVPYRDFVLLHPPGIMLLFAPIALVVHAIGSWSDVLVVARWLTVLVSAVNVVLVAHLAWRWKGWLAAVIAGVLYASYLPAVHTESHVMLEPFVTLGVLVAAALWSAAPAGGRADRWAAAIGAVAALTMLTKLTGGVALLAVLAIGPVRGQRRLRAVAAATGAAVAFVVLVPFVVLSGPSTMFDQVVTTQLQRPGNDVSGGTIQGLGDRLDLVGSYGSFALNRAGGSAGLVGIVVAVLAIAWAWRSGNVIGRFFAIASVAGSVAILVAPDFYDQYPVTVFAGLAVIIGCAATSAVDALGAESPTAAGSRVRRDALFLAAGVADTVVSVREDERDRHIADPGVLLDAKIGGACISADLPEMVLALDRLPPRDEHGDLFVDPFGALMFEALRHGDYRDTASALHSTQAQALLRSALRSCPYAVTRGPLDTTPGRWSDSTRRWFLDRFEIVARNDAGLTLWRRTASAA